MPAYDALTRAERRTYLDSIAAGAPRVTRLRVLDLDHNLLAELDDVLIGGQVDVTRVRGRDNADLTTRVFSGQLLDASRAVSWDADSPSPLALWPSRMLQVIDGHYVEGLGVVRHKTFTGPVVGYGRAGAVVMPRCVGKEFLAQRELGATRKWSKGTPIVEVLRELMEATGETRFDLPDLDAKLAKPLRVEAPRQVWPVVQRLARGRDLHAYYPGNGRFTVRRLPGNVSLLWTPGEGGLVLSDVETSFALKDNFANDTIVTGKRRKVKAGTEKRTRHRRVRGRYRPNPGHDLAPRELTRGGVPGRFPERIHNPKIGRDAKAQEIAERRGKGALRMGVDAQFNHYPGVPYDEGDLHAVTTEDHGKVKFRVREFTIPYEVGGGETTQSLNRLRRMRAARK